MPARFTLIILVLALAGPLLGARGEARGAGIPGVAAVPVGAGSGPALFTVGMEGGFTGARLVATAYPDGLIRLARAGGGRAPHTTEMRVPLSRAAVRAVLRLAERSHVLAISRALQDRRFGADIPVLSFSLRTSGGMRSVHVQGSESDHLPGTGAFFPIWNLLYALAGYPALLD